MAVLARGDDPGTPAGSRPRSSVTGPGPCWPGGRPRNPPLTRGPGLLPPSRGLGPWSVAALRRDEVDQFLDPAEELRFEIGEAGHRAQDALPCPGGVGRPAEGAQHAFLPGLARGNPRPAADA